MDALKRPGYFLFLFFFVPIGLTGQEKEADGRYGGEKDVHSQEIGAAFGLTTGYGLSYRFWPSRFGVQGTAFYLKRLEGGYPDVNGSYGLTFLYMVADGEVTDLFLYQGNHLLYDRYRGISTPCRSFPCPREMVTTRNLFNGLGFGMRFIILKRIDLSLMTGYALTTEELFKGHSTYGLTITAEAGLFYRF